MVTETFLPKVRAAYAAAFKAGALNHLYRVDDRTTAYNPNKSDLSQWTPEVFFNTSLSSAFDFLIRNLDTAKKELYAKFTF